MTQRQTTSSARTLSIWLSILATLVFSSAVFAQAKTPQMVVQDAVDRALAVLRDPAMQSPDKREVRFDKVRAIVSGAFDWEDMARRSLGVHWRSIDAEQRSQFVALFQELLAERYMEDINRFRGDEHVMVGGMRREGETYRVETLVVTHSREKVPINYFLHADGDSFRIHDFSVEGVSLVNHYRKTFSRFLVNRDFSELLQKLGRKKLRRSE